MGWIRFIASVHEISTCYYFALSSYRLRTSYYRIPLFFVFVFGIPVKEKKRGGGGFPLFQEVHNNRVSFRRASHYQKDPDQVTSNDVITDRVVLPIKSAKIKLRPRKQAGSKGLSCSKGLS